jgi:hypothetical protein
MSCPDCPVLVVALAVGSRWLYSGCPVLSVLIYLDNLFRLSFSGSSVLVILFWLSLSFGLSFSSYRILAVLFLLSCYGFLSMLLPVPAVLFFLFFFWLS